MPMFQPSVSRDTVVADFAALLALPAPTDGQAAVVVAPVVGTLLTGGIPRTRWVYISGEGWRPAGVTVLCSSHPRAVSSPSASTLNLFSVPLSAGLLLNVREIRFDVVCGKNGTTDSATMNLLLDSSPVGAAQTVSAAQRTGAMTTRLKSLSAASVAPIWNGAQDIVGGGSGLTPLQVWSTPNQGSAMNFVVTWLMSGTTNAAISQYLRISVE